MSMINWSELFPGKWSAVIFFLYITLFVNQGIIIKWSQDKGEYNYNIVIVVLMTEVLKLLSSVVLYCKENAFKSLFQEIFKYRKVLLLYMVPSSLYCLYNNLSFVNLAAFDPPTYFLLLQLRVVITGIIFQIVFKKKLSSKQWIALILLTLGCMIKHLNLDYNNAFSQTTLHLNINIVFIFIQTICSCLAGVYNEYLLKGEAANVNIFVQNVFMYVDSILCNVAVLLVQGHLIEAFDNAGSSIFMDPKVILIMCNNAAIGIVTSFFLKNLNSIVKTFASALELVFTAVFCWILFGIPIYLNTALAIAIVSFAVILYSQNPVQNVKSLV
ncbi:PREDICTED: CMP-sialic acid transporter 1 [Ceratosolen solmsi marchali]|uniref:CMP-sialic acid transporter 1 n=1 Tax=Ceratosolen solmsi marchali TaxID=326594 RepID=A0AAJ6YLT9_9HYME|nr:PREDICTED: CMP-sialic acid transporter 1 [Ceratosolen solmsi marchali]